MENSKSATKIKCGNLKKLNLKELTESKESEL